jgi:type III secretion system low calcium response chaperone LcrH/SycD
MSQMQHTAVAPTRPAAAAAGAGDDPAGSLSDAQAEAIYASGYHLCQQGRYDQGGALFALLTLHRPVEVRYAYALGICFRKMGRHEDAIKLFALVMELRPTDLEPAFELIECLLLLGRRDQAYDLLDKIAEVARIDEDVETLRRAVGMMEILLSPAQ